MKSKRDEKRQADDWGPAATAEAEALLSLATQEALSLPASSRRTHTLAALAKQAMQLKAMKQLEERIVELEEVLSQRRSYQDGRKGRSAGGTSQRYRHSSQPALSSPGQGVRRVEGLYPKLSAKERAKLVLKWVKADEPIDPLVTSTMPPEQAEEFNRLRHLLIGVTDRFGVARELSHMVETDAVRLTLLRVVHLLDTMSGDMCDLLRDVSRSCIIFLKCHTKEPITQSEYSQKLEEEPLELVPIRELAAWEAQDSEEWEPEEFLEALRSLGDGSHSEVPSGEAQQQVVAEKQAMLEALVAQGTLEAVQTDKGTSIRLGSYYGWKGQEVSIHSQWARGFDIRPDEEAEEVDRWRKDREALRGLLRETSVGKLSRFEALTEPTPPLLKEKKALKMSLKESIQVHWATVEAIQKVLAEMSEEFDGEDPATPQLRELLEDIAKRLQELYKESKKLVGNYRLSKPVEGIESATRELAHM